MPFIRLFQQLDYPPFDSRILRKNVRAHMADGSLFVFAMSFISVQTVLPVFVSQLGGSSLAVGSVGVLWMLGLNLPQALFIRLTHRPGPVKPVLLRYALLFRYFFLFLGLAAFAFGFIPAGLVVPAFLILVAATAVAGSLGLAPWFQLFTKTTPVLLRGRLIAVRQLIGSLLGIIGGSVVVFVLSNFPAPLNYSILFFCAFIASIGSYLFLREIREDCGGEEQGGKEYRHEEPLRMGSILRRDARLRNYLIGDALILVSMTASGFYAVYGLQKLGLPESSAGMFTIVSMAGMVIGNLVFGHLADRYGHRLNLILLLCFCLLADLIALFAGGPVLYSVVFALMSFSISLQGISRLPFVAELCNESERPVYIAIVNTVTAPVILAGVAAGAFVKAIGYEDVFLAYIVLTAAGVYWMWKRVEEPRFIEPQGLIWPGDPNNA